MIMIRSMISLVSGFCLVAATAAADDADEPPKAEQIAAADVQGRPKQDLVEVQNARYFVWHDSSGWHLRSAAKGFVKFNGSIKLTDGTFGRLRPIGLETKGKYADRWEVNADRSEIRFEIFTGGSFDGFDFDIRRQSDEARIACDLKMGRESTRRPARIYLGRDSKHPTVAHFETSATPDLVKK